MIGLVACLGLLAPLAQDASAAPRAEPVELRFAPREGSSVRRTITIDHRLVAQEMVVGRQTSQEQVSVQARHKFSVLDRYLRLGQDRPLELARRFDELSWQGDMLTPGGRDSIPAVSPLRGTSVRYTWIPEESAYGRYFDAREAPEEALLDLAEDLDLRALLPGHPVRTGESWSVPAAALADVFSPCGRLDLRFDAPRTSRNLLRTLRNGLAGNFREFYGGESSGECRVTLAGVEEREGTRLATLELEFQCTNKVDQRALVQSQMSGPEVASGYRCLAASASWSTQGKGRCVWNLSAARAARLTLAGEQQMVLENELSIANKPGLKQRMSFTGGLNMDWAIDDPAALAKAAADPPK